MKKLYECKTDYAKNKLWNIRKDIVLNSLYYSDYENRYGYNVYMICNFFDGFLEYVENLMFEDIPGFKDEKFFDYLAEYDTKENIWEWYCMIEDIEF